MALNVLCLSQGAEKTAGVRENTQRKGGTKVKKGAGNRNGSRAMKRVFSVFLTIAITIAFTSVALADLTPPNWMPGFPLMAGTQLMLMWGPVPGAAKYRVVMNGKTLIETPSYQHFMAAPEQAGEYKITVLAIDATGKAGPPSREWSTKIVKIAPPATVFYREMDSGAVSIRWEPVAGAVVYNVFKKEGEKGENKLIASVQDIAYSDSAVAKDKEFFYSVSAKDVAGRESAPSSPIKVMVATKVEAKVTAFQKLIPLTSSVLKHVRNYEIAGNQYWVKAPGGAISVGGNIYYTEIISGNIFVLDPGSYGGVRVFGEAGDGEGKLSRPFGIDADKSGNLYVADAFASKIVKFASDGKFIKEFPLPEFEQTRVGAKEIVKAGPIDLRILMDGRIMVVDNAGSRLLLLDENGKVLKIINEFSDGKNKTSLSRPTAIDIDPATEEMYIVDALSNRIVVVNKDGKLLRTIGEPGDIVGTFAGVLGVALDVKRGWVVAVDSKNSNLQVFDMKTGKYLYSVAGNKPDGPIEISKPQKLRQLPDGSFILTEGLIDRDGGGLLVFNLSDK